MSYALLPREGSPDVERGGPPQLRSSPSRGRAGSSPGGLPLPPPFSNARQFVRSPRLKILLVSITGTLLVLSLFSYAPGQRSTYSRPTVLLDYGADSDRWHLDYRVRPQLHSIREDGEALPLKDGATAARWPEDYPEAVDNFRENGVLRSVRNPWPEKPWIASIWLAAERFPDGLHGLPHDPTPLPEMGKENGRKPAPGLHDPPLPNFPKHPQDYQRVQQLPRDAFKIPTNWVPPSGMPQPGATPPVQASQTIFNEDRLQVTEQRRQWVKRAFLHAYEGYKKHAFGHDEITPLSRQTRDSYNTWGATTVDSLDLLLLMNLTHEYNVARTHVRSLDFTLLAEKFACQGESGPLVHLFETVIRYLGGFLSAYDLSGDDLMLQRAKELGDWLLPAFNTANGWPIAFYNLGDNPKGAPVSRTLAAEVGSLSMELSHLSQITGDLAYFNAAQRIQDSLSKFKGEYGTLVSHIIAPSGGHWGDFTIGGMVDSYYEYQIKMVQLLGDTTGVYAKMYEQAVRDMYEHLAINVTVTPDRSGLVILGARASRSPIRATQEHLATFAGGMFGLGSRLLSRTKDLLMAIELTESAVWAYRSTATGLMPEIMDYYAPTSPSRYSYISGKDREQERAKQKGVPLGVQSQMDKEYKGRPETIESVFYMYRITGDPKWQDYGWRMFTSWVKNSLTSVGFGNIQDVNQPSPSLVDIQESFVLTETLKYYYLLFSPADFVSLDDYVFNTEAHPFKVPLREHSTFWTGPEAAVDAAYSDPRDRHFFSGSNEFAAQAPTGRGTAKQQQWRADNCQAQTSK